MFNLLLVSSVGSRKTEISEKGVGIIVSRGLKTLKVSDRFIGCGVLTRLPVFHTVENK